MSYTDKFTGVTYPWSEEWELRQPGETEPERGTRVGTAKFDHEYFLEYGRYPAESPLFGTTPQRDDSRRHEAIQALIDRGATEGEREAARAALHRLDHPSTAAHGLTEQGSYYARDRLAGSSDE